MRRIELHKRRGFSICGWVACSRYEHRIRCEGGLSPVLDVDSALGCNECFQHVWAGIWIKHCRWVSRLSCGTMGALVPSCSAFAYQNFQLQHSYDGESNVIMPTYDMLVGTYWGLRHGAERLLADNGDIHRLYDIWRLPLMIPPTRTSDRRHSILTPTPPYLTSITKSPTFTLGRWPHDPLDTGPPTVPLPPAFPAASSSTSPPTPSSPPLRSPFIASAPDYTTCQAFSAPPASIGPASFRLLFQNVPGLIGGMRNDSWRVCAKFAHLRSSLARVDVSIWVEAHGNAPILRALRHEFPDHLFWGSFINQRAGGVLFAMSKAFASRFTDTPHFHTLYRGRVAYLRCNSPEGGFDLYGVHLCPQWTNLVKQDALRSIHRVLRPAQEAHSIIAGDFNYLPPDEGMYHFLTGAVTRTAAPLHDLFLNLFPFFSDINDDYPTHRDFSAEGVLNSASRLDRIYSNLFPVLLHDHEPHLHSPWHLLQHPEISDHIPLILTFPEPRLASPPASQVPLWIAKHPSFTTHVNDVIASQPDWGTGDVTERYHRLAATLTKATHLTRLTTRHSPTASIDEAIAIAITATRAATRHQPRLVASCLRRLPALVPFFRDNQLVDAPGLTKHIAEAVSMTYQQRLEQQASIDALRGHDPAEARVKKRNRSLARWAARFSFRNQRVVLGCVTEPDGTPAASLQRQVDLIREHWLPIFQAPQPDSRHFSFFADFVVTAPSYYQDVAAFLLSAADFADMLRLTHDSSLGPDGIPYAAWRNAGHLVRQELHDLYLYCLTTECLLPPGFNHACFCFLPKELDDLTHLVVSRTADKLRTLTLSNTSHKLFAASLVHPLSRMAQLTCISCQRGWLKGRVMLDNVLEIDTYAKLYTYYHAAFPVLLSFDLRRRSRHLPGPFYGGFSAVCVFLVRLLVCSSAFMMILIIISGSRVSLFLVFCCSLVLYRAVLCLLFYSSLPLTRFCVPS